MQDEWEDVKSVKIDFGLAEPMKHGYGHGRQIQYNTDTGDGKL